MSSEALRRPQKGLRKSFESPQKVLQMSSESPKKITQKGIKHFLKLLIKSVESTNIVFKKYSERIQKVSESHQKILRNDL